MSTFHTGRPLGLPAAFTPRRLSALLSLCLSFMLPAQALTYAEARQLAERQNPGLRAQQFALEGASAAQPAAGTLPDPRLSLGIENLPASGTDRWSLSRDFMTMKRIALMQEVPNQAKRTARLEGAQARTERERAMLQVQRLQVRQALDLAWITAQSLEDKRALLHELQVENQRLQDTLPARIAGGAPATDLLMARQEALSLADRQDELQRDADKVRATLRRLLGPQGDEALEGDIPLPDLPPEDFKARLTHHAALAVYPAMLAMARAEINEANAESRGDWAWEVAYSRRGAQWGDMVSFQLSFDLPWQKGKRQHPIATAKQRDLERIEAEREEAERRHRQELEEELAELQSLGRQVERLDGHALPLAQDRVALALSSYQAGRADLAAVLGARGQVLEQRLRRIDLQAQRSGLLARLHSLIAD
ncbi:TolC family protein [Mitsuaria sp. WAJ17]|uniref:TolC family protein n=1 Tax=Mitsuaria sp. WAJ17 TaxID=2761452 RepID=UPI0016039B73|nr:TolC family protein [Mitsuaria sp. WAJ17]MBB2487467.1 TolC family protein [Mitsuaria sp. WAJ17]